jgi:hypothetical protein
VNPLSSSFPFVPVRESKAKTLPAGARRRHPRRRDKE